MARPVADECRMGTARRICRRRPVPPRPRLGTVPLLRAHQPGPRRSRLARLHLRPPARLRRRPHRRDRQHHPQAAAGREALDGRRLLLLARALDDRVRPDGGARSRHDDGQLAHPRLPGSRRLHRRVRLRHLPDRDRDPQPDRAPRHPRRVPPDEARRLQRAEARGRAAEPGPDEPLLPQARGRQDRHELEDVSARDPLRARLRHGHRDRAARDRGRRRDPPGAVPRDHLAADHLRRGDEPDGHRRRRLHEPGLRLGVLEPGAQGLLQHHGDEPLGGGGADHRRRSSCSR